MAFHPEDEAPAAREPQMAVHYWLRHCESGDPLHLVVLLPPGRAIPLPTLAAEPPAHCMPADYVFAHEFQPQIEMVLRNVSAIKDDDSLCATRVCTLDPDAYENEVGRKMIEIQRMGRTRRHSRPCVLTPLAPTVERLAMLSPTALRMPSAIALTRSGSSISSDFTEDGRQSYRDHDALPSCNASPLSPRRPRRRHSHESVACIGRRVLDEWA